MIFFWSTAVLYSNIILGTSSYKLVYKESDNPKLFQIYSDTSYSSCKKSGCPTGSYTTIVCGRVVG